MLSPASLLSEMVPRVIDQNASHELRRDAKEVSTAFPIHLALLHEPNIGFVNESGGSQSVIRPLVPHMACGQVSQLVIHDRD